MRANSLTRLRFNGGKLLLSGVAALLLTGCSLNRAAVNAIGDALAGGGVYASDDDPELIREALPFGLKTFESLLEVSPEHRGLLLAAARGFTSYAYLLQNHADRLEAAELRATRELRIRARKLYLRGRDYALRGLELDHPAFASKLSSDGRPALAAATKQDVPFLYWAGVSWAGALSTAKDDLDLIAQLPTAAALVRRVLELDERYDLGAAHEFFISYEGSRPGGDIRLAREHYRRALELSQGKRASTHLALAEAVSLREQNSAEFKSLVAATLRIDPDGQPSLRLANAVSKQRARWLEARIPDLFVEAGRKDTER